METSYAELTLLDVQCNGMKCAREHARISDERRRAFLQSIDGNRPDPRARRWASPRLPYTPRVRIPSRLALLILLVAAPVALVGQSRLPTPESVLGFRPGADYKLATYDQSIDYFKKLAAASKYVKLVEAGKTSQGRTMYFALISTPDNLAKIDRYREIARRLAHPQGLTDAEAQRLARDGKAFVHIDGGLHATEVAGPQHTPQLLYDLVSKADEPDTKAILDNVVLMLWPTINPDGQQMVAEWYMKNVGTPYELSGLPRLYQEYVGHDNNRDAYMLNMVESRVLEHTWRQWEPQIIYVHHQSGPFPTRIWLPPFSEPVGIDAPFIMSREVNMIGMAIAKGLEEHGQVGATHMGTAFDAWYPGYVDYAPNFKNIAAFWTETALFQYATPHDYTHQRLPAEHARPAAAEPVLEPVAAGHVAAARRGRLHGDGVAVGARVRRRSTRTRCSTIATRPGAIRSRSGTEEGALRLLHSAAAARPGGRRRDAAPPRVRRRARLHADRAGHHRRRNTSRAGTWVIPTDQEFAAMAREVLDAQAYPDLRQYPGGPPERPYDAAGLVAAAADGRPRRRRRSPLTDEMRADDEAARRAARRQGRSRRPTRRRCRHDAAPFDSLPGVGFNTDPASAAIVPLPGRISGIGFGAGPRPGAEQHLQARSTARGSRARRCRPAPARRARRFATRCAGSRPARRTSS